MVTSVSADQNYLINVNGILYFQGSDAINGAELWKSNGTGAGTMIVKDINPGLDPNFSNSGSPAFLFNANGILYFAATDGVTANGTELWKSDGTEAGTVLVKNINPGSGSSSPEGFALSNGILFFTAFDETNGHELWKTDGTAIGTVLVKNIVPTPGGSPQKFVACKWRCLLFNIELRL